MRRHHPTTTARAQRHALTVDCQIVRERDFRLVADRMMDLSISGALAVPAEPVLTGEALIVSFRMPGAERWFDIEAFVQRVAHGRREGEHARALGIAFERFLEGGRYPLAWALRAFPPAPPRLRPGRRDTVRSSRRLARLSSRSLVRPRPALVVSGCEARLHVA